MYQLIDAITSAKAIAQANRAKKAKIDYVGHYVVGLKTLDKCDTK